VVYMPMIPEAAMAMLACARTSAIHSVVFEGFALRELAIRIDDAKPQVILLASFGIEVERLIPYKPLLDEALRISKHAPEKCVVLQRSQAKADLAGPRHLDWAELEEEAQPAPYVPVESTDPLYIPYTSGTTGVPKGVVRDNGGHAVALNWTMDHIYGIDPGDVF
jgi:propionyl-CoA synthetase